MSLKPLLSVAGLTLREAWRLRLWIPVLLAGLVIITAGLRLGAVGEDARLKLAVVTITGAIAFVVVLLSILQGPSQLRRDLDTRTAFLLFSKPIPRVQYLIGRWLGVLGGLLAAVIGLSLLGTLVMGWSLGKLPDYRAITKPAEWTEVSPLGEVVAINEKTDRRPLSGPAGGAIRWTFKDLPSNPEGYELLLRVQLRGESVQQTLVSIAAAADPAHFSLLSLHPNGSPYGQATDATGTAPGQLVLLHRDPSRADFGQDFAHLLLPASAVAPDGTCVVQVTRLQSDVQIVMTKEATLLVAQPGGSFIANLLRAGLVVMGIAALLAAWTLLVASLSNLGVTLLAGLTLYFAGSILWIIPDALVYDGYSVPMQRLLQLVMNVFPDLERFDVAGSLAAGRSVTWKAVGLSWLYYGIYTAVFLTVGWLTLRKREL